MGGIRTPLCRIGQRVEDQRRGTRPDGLSLVLNRRLSVAFGYSCADNAEPGGAYEVCRLWR